MVDVKVASNRGGNRELEGGEVGDVIQLRQKKSRLR